MRPALLALAIILMSSTALSHDHGQWAQADPWLRDWFRSQKIPGTNQTCCNEADGVYAEEDIRDNEYWTRFKPCAPNINCAVTDWMRVPPHVVIRGPNQSGAPVAWYVISWHGNPPVRTVTIRCFAPGSGM